LSSEELRSGGTSLQAALVDLIRTNEYIPQDSTRIIKPQIISTLPVLVDFPPLKPVLVDKRKIFAITGKRIIYSSKLKDKVNWF
jgi:hypothetical protein